MLEINTSRDSRAQAARSVSTTGELRKAAPYSLETEQALLGAILVNNEAHDRVSGFLEPQHFFDPLHADIYRTAGQLIAENKQANPFTLKSFLENAEPIDAQTSVWTYLGRLAANATTIVNARDYGQAIYDLHIRRQMIVIGEDMVNAAFETPVDFPPAKQIDEAIARITALEEEDSKDAQRPKMITAASFADKPVPPRDWHAKDYIPHGQVTLLTGDGAAGKSLLAQQLCASTAIGRCWLGVEVARGAALYLNAEDDYDELHRRTAAIARHMDVGLDRFSDVHLWSLAGCDAVLASAEERGNIVRPTPLWRKLERTVATLQPRLIILDPLANLFAGNEIIRAQAQQFVGLLRGLAIRHDAAVVLVAHPSLTGIAQSTGSSGSTGWGNSVRARLYMERKAQDGKADDDSRVLKTTKSNYSAHGREVRVRWCDGVFVLDSDAAAAAARAERDQADDQAFLNLLIKFDSQDIPASHLNNRNSAPALMADHPAAGGISKERFRLAMHRLLDAKRIHSIKEGPPSKPRHRLVVVS